MAVFLAIGLFQGGFAVEVARLSADQWARPNVLAYLLACFSGGSALGVLACFLPQRLRPNAVLPRAATLATLVGALGVPALPFGVVPVAAVIGGAGCGALAVLLNATMTANPEAIRRANVGNGFFGIGAVIGPSMANWSGTGVGWVLPAIVVVLLAATGLPAGRAMVGLTDIRPASGDRSYLALGILLFAAFCYGGVENVMAGLLPQHLGALRISSIGFYVSCLWGAMAVGRFAVAAVAKRLNAQGVTLICGVGALFGCALLTHSGAAFAGTVLVGLCAGPLLPTLLAAVAHQFSAGHGSRSVLVCSLSGAAVHPVLADLLLRGAVAPTFTVPLAEGLLLLLFVFAVFAGHRMLRVHGPARRAAGADG
jgi:fucose permease